MTDDLFILSREWGKETELIPLQNTSLFQIQSIFERRCLAISQELRLKEEYRASLL